MSNALTRLLNIMPFAPGKAAKAGKDPKRHLSNYAAHAQVMRARQNVSTWRDAIKEAEQEFYPQRVKMQNLYNDTIQNGHVFACMEARKELTLLRDFEVYVKETKSEEMEEWLKSEWFMQLMSHCLDAIFFGYTLVSLGDIVDSTFPDMQVVRRWLVSPDRLEASSFPYGLTGPSFMENPYKDWHIWAPTPTENGMSVCGYGLLYKVALYEIITRNVLAYNVTAAELFGMPFRHGKTDKTDENERAEFEAMMQNMGSAGWAVTDVDDLIEFIAPPGGTGKGFEIYDNIEKRSEQKISKIILGHADALDSVPGKLGNDSEESPAHRALKRKQVKDGRYIENLVSNQLFPKLRRLGFAIPDEALFKFKNDEERYQAKRREIESSKGLADVADVMKRAGLQMSADYFQEETGIPTEAISEGAPVVEDPAEFKSIENRLRELYT